MSNPQATGSLSNSQPLGLMLLIVMALQLGFIFLVPILGDEAYFVSWGRYLSLGYYDHPPTTGWLAYLISELNTSGNVHRLFVFILGLINSYLFYRHAQTRLAEPTARHLTLALMALPVYVMLFSAYTNDTLLLFFLSQFFLASHTAFSLQKSKPQQSFLFAGIAGVFLGLALLTKYTAIIFYGALSIFLLINAKHYWKFLFTQYLITSFTALCLFLINIYWNYNNCGINFAFNFVFRDAEVNVIGAEKYLASFVVLLAPLIIFFLIKPRTFKLRFTDPNNYFFTPIFLITFVVLLLIAIQKGDFNVHWGAPLMILGFLSLTEIIVETDAIKLSQWSLGFGIIIVLPLLLVVGLLKFNVISAANAFGEGYGYKANMMFDLTDDSLINEIANNYPHHIIASTSYSIIGMLDTNRNFQTALLFNKSKFGRSQDIFVDYRKLDGTNILFLVEEPVYDINKLQPFFDEVKQVSIKGTKASYTAFEGTGFHYATYLDRHIRILMRKFYDQIPKMLYGACYMDKYR